MFQIWHLLRNVNIMEMKLYTSKYTFNIKSVFSSRLFRYTFVALQQYTQQTLFIGQKKKVGNIAQFLLPKA